MNAPRVNRTEASGSATAIDDRSFERLAQIAHAEAGIVISESKRNLVVSRLARRLRELGMSDFRSYCDLVEDSRGREERRQLIFMLTTNVTRFFREYHHFEILSRKIMPELARRARSGGRVRLWSAGCSSGEEPYSIAMTVLEALPEAPRLDVRVLATDLDANMVEAARGGVYRNVDESQLPHTMRERYFRPSEDTPGAVSAGDALRGILSFSELNLHRDWPMTGAFDVIFCRNVVIYFDAVAQARLWQRFAEKLVPDGSLFIGHSERVAGPATAVLASDGVTRYRKRPPAGTAGLTGRTA